MLSTLIELIGFACLVVGAFFVYPVAALFVAGVCLLIIAQADPTLPRLSLRKAKP
jgi:hypothetical protein